VHGTTLRLAGLHLLPQLRLRVARWPGHQPGALYWPLPRTKRLDWGLSQLNLNNSFTASILYDLPLVGQALRWRLGGAENAVLGNWQINVIERATSGFPLFVVDSTNPSGVDFSYNV